MHRATISGVAAVLGAFFFMTAPAEAQGCGGEGERPCNIWERIPSCNAGLREDFLQNLCVRPSAPRPAPADCGGDGERPCRLWERIPSCDPGMAENSLSDSCVAAGPGHLRRQADQAVRDLRPLFDLGFSVAECVSASGRIGQIEQLLTSRSNEGAARALLNMSCATRALTVARQNGYQTVTIGIGGSAQFGFGVNSEIGIAFDTSDRYQPVGYSTLGYTTGWGAALSNEVIVSFYKDDLRGLASDAQGFSYSGAAVAGGGATVWYDYDGRQSGASAAAGIGAGGEIGVYNRVTTQLLGAVRPQTRNSGPDRLAPAKGAVISGDYRLTDRDATNRFEMLGDNALRVTRLQNGRPTEWHVYNRVNAHTFRADTSRATYSVLRDGTLRWQSNSDRNLVIDLVEDTFSETGIVWQ